MEMDKIENVSLQLWMDIKSVTLEKQYQAI